MLSVLPCTINICVAQTLAAGGNMGTAIFNAIFANVCGVFLTPLLAIWTLGAGRGVSLLRCSFDDNHMYWIFLVYFHPAMKLFINFCVIVYLQIIDVTLSICSCL